MHSTANASERLDYLDGLRAIAALVVLNEHILKIFFGSAFVDTSMPTESFKLFDFLSFPPLNIFHNGAWAVCLFFVLSGYALSFSFFNGKSCATLQLAKMLGRYFRLAIPVTASLMLVALFSFMGAIKFGALTSVTYSTESNAFHTPLTFVDAIRLGVSEYLFSVRFEHNPPLWTMAVEFIFSIALFAFLAFFSLFSTSSNAFLIRNVIYAFCLVYFISDIATAFVLGCLLCDWNTQPSIKHFLQEHKSRWLPITFILGIVLCGYSIRGLYHGFYSVITFDQFDASREYIYNTWGAFFLILSISYSLRCQRWLSAPGFLFLGRHSFAIYLTHYLLLASVSAQIFFFLPIESYLYKSVLTIVLSLPIIFAFSIIFTWLICDPALKVSQRITFSVNNTLIKLKGIVLETKANCGFSER